MSDQDYERVAQYKWYASLNKKKGIWYAKRGQWDPGTQTTKTVWMHRFIKRAKPGQQVDHRDRDGLNNQRENLRFINTSRNLANSVKRIGDCTSKFKGVYLDKRRDQWIARVQYKNKKVWIGSFKTQEEAALAYNEAAKDLFGAYARLNDL